VVQRNNNIALAIATARPSNGIAMTGSGYLQTKLATLQSVGFSPESRNRPVENRVIC